MGDKNKGKTSSLRCFILASVLLTGLAGRCIAQSTNINDIKKINFIDAEGALGFGRETKFELTQVNNEWVCNQTKQNYRSMYAKPNEKDYYAKENEQQQKFVKKVDKNIIKDFLKTIATPKSKYSSDMFAITPKLLVEYVDTSSYLKYFKEKISEEHRKIILAELTKAANIKVAIDTLQHDWWTDDYPYCGIHIILKNNDTVKVETNRQPVYMQPWKINGIVSYDLNINKFFIAVMGDYRKSNKARLNGNLLPYQIYNEIYHRYAEAAIIKYDWQKQDSPAYDKFKRLFEFRELKSYVGFSIRNPTYVIGQLGSAELPENAVIEANISANDLNFLDKLSKFKDSVKQCFKTGNFVFNYYQKKPLTTIKFGWSQHGSRKLFTSLSQHKFEDLKKSNPTYTSQNILCFTVVRQNDRSEWFLLPDDKLIMVSYFKPDVAGLKDNPLKATNSYWKQCFVVFDNTGKILSQ